MQSKAATVAQYLAELPPDRREAIAAVRKVILDNLDAGFSEGMQYGMIGYHVPHKDFPAGYHCDPKQPLPYAGLASQKQSMSLYVPVYMAGGPFTLWFNDAWAKTGKKLDMGKACIRFKKVDDLALDVIAEMFRRLPAKKFVELYQQSLASRPGPMPREKIKAMVAKRKAGKAAARPKATKAAGGTKAAKKKAGRR